MIAYLTGPMDQCPDRGTTWRNALAARLRADGWTVFSPTENVLEIGPAREYRAKLKAVGKWEEFSQEMRAVRQADLAQIALADVVIVHLGPPAAGTYFEICIARELGKLIVVHANTLQQVPDWLWSEFHYSSFFDDWDRLLAAVRKRGNKCLSY